MATYGNAVSPTTSDATCLANTGRIDTKDDAPSSNTDGCSVLEDTQPIAPIADSALADGPLIVVPAAYEEMLTEVELPKEEPYDHDEFVFDYFAYCAIGMVMVPRFEIAVQEVRSPELKRARDLEKAKPVTPVKPVKVTAKFLFFIRPVDYGE